MTLNDITDDELQNYLVELVPRLLREPPTRWVRIDTIAKDVARFINICQCLADHGCFRQPDDPRCVIEIKEDSLVRLDPCYINLKTRHI
jgi:hypothetical protein